MAPSPFALSGSSPLRRGLHSRAPRELPSSTRADFVFWILWLPEVDDGEMRPPGHYRKGVQFAFPALALPNTKVFPHCSGGLNRGPTMCYAILRAFGFPQTDAIR
jgi:hypothetical protein